MKTLVVGAAMIDIVMVMDKLPKSGEDVLCKDSKLKIGGCAYNVGSTLKNLECEHDLCVPVGNGSYGKIIETELCKNDYKIMIKDENKDNGYCMCMVEADGERTFVTYQGIEGDFQTEWFEKLDMSQYDNIYIAGYQVCNHSGKVISEWLKKQNNKNIYFAPGPVICMIEKDTMDRMMEVKPILHLNDKEAYEFTGQDTIENCIKMLYQKNQNTVIVTLGDEGAAYFDGQDYRVIPSRKAVVVDTIGAGDSHIGAIIGGLSKGKNVAESIALANEVAANIVGVYGPTMDKNTFDERMEKNNE
ncbi:MAG: PfkB family carbohydrate kinase [Lachnospiraceae bacterium]|nr:PfkB family carbohydrate kinase [Lachnospiraceae bacterium]